MNDANGLETPSLPGASGSAAADLARHLVPVLEAAGVVEVELDVFVKEPSFHGPEISESASSIAHAAREEHLRRGFGFWQVSLAAAVDADAVTRRGLFAGALRHSTGQGIRMALSIRDLREYLTDGHFEGLPPRTVIALCSRMARADGTVAHIAMLDFAVPSASAQGEQAAVDALRALEVTGALFASGKSFHFYGDEFLDDAGLVTFLARAQLLTPIMDERWATHQLIDGECRLRVGWDIERNRDPVRFVTHVR